MNLVSLFSLWLIPTMRAVQVIMQILVNKKVIKDKTRISSPFAEENEEHDL